MTAAGNTTKENATRETANKKPGPSAAIWSAARACLFLAAAIFFYVHGKSLAPGSDPQLSPREPTVTVLTTDPQFTGSVDMSLFASGTKPQQYNLRLTITPATPAPKGTQVQVSFGRLPQPIPSLKISFVSSPQSGKEYYQFLSPTPTATGTQTYTYTYKSAQQIGEAANAGRLRVAFPTFTGETPGAQFTAPACGPKGSVAGGPDAAICRSLGPPGSAARDQWSVPVLHAGQSTLNTGGLGLAGYQYLAGDTPTLLNGTGWNWTGVNGATVLAADVAAEDTQQSNVFYSGIFLGVAAAAAMAFITELLRPLWRRDP